MTWFLPRLLIIVVVMAAGSVAGYMLGDRIRAPLLSALVGATCGAGAMVVIDTLRGMRLIRWLRGARARSAPRDTGLWGEIGSRVERSLRSLEKQCAQERTRLTQFLSAIEASPNGVILLDVGNHIDWCNAVAADHFGLDPQRDLRQRVTNLVRAPAFVAYLQEERFDEPVSFPGPRGDVTLSVLVRRYGEDLKIVLSQDVTVQERADAMRRDFVANVSHEIRTPLTVLNGFIETLDSLTLDESERRRLLELMKQQARRMDLLVADLLTLAKLEGSPRPEALNWFDLAELLERIEAEAKGLSLGRHKLVFSGLTGLQIAASDNEAFSAIINLTSNAVRYTPTGGAIEVAWRMRADGSAEVSVTDNGPGIAREHLPRVTERFYRVDSSRSRDTGGTGLGLSIVKHVMQRHGGELEVHSEPGRGSCFRLVFPPARTRRVGADRGTRPEADRSLGQLR
ncbi:MAG: phosphate regulon sensor histidine kinase PhoR [Rhizobacter sp.]|nr:phosphate regulon sensor histidine kinase PhoR [Rhizobacter sp.]